VKTFTANLLPQNC